jgi:hypothetical protein
MNVHGLDLGHATTREAEHWLADLPPVPGLVACTHLVHQGHRRVVITLAARRAWTPRRCRTRRTARASTTARPGRRRMTTPPAGRGGPSSTPVWSGSSAC